MTLASLPYTGLALSFVVSAGAIAANVADVKRLIEKKPATNNLLMEINLILKKKAKAVPQINQTQIPACRVPRKGKYFAGGNIYLCDALWPDSPSSRFLRIVLVKELLCLTD